MANAASYVKVIVKQSLASLGRRKPVHFVSTLAVFLARGSSSADRVGEEDEPGGPAALEDGYAQSKRVAERLVAEAGARGLPARIYRPARITGDARTGRGNPGDLLSRLVRGCVQLGMAPELDVLLDMAPVDFVAAVDAHGSPAQRARARTRVASEHLDADGERWRAEGLALLEGTGRQDDPDERVTRAHLLLAQVAVDDVNEAFRAAAGSALDGILRYTDDPLVSTDIQHSPFSCIFDSELTMAHGRTAKVFGWYDNEWGYSCRLVDLMGRLL